MSGQDNWIYFMDEHDEHDEPLSYEDRQELVERGMLTNDDIRERYEQ